MKIGLKNWIYMFRETTRHAILKEWSEIEMIARRELLTKWTIKQIKFANFTLVDFDSSI